MQYCALMTSLANSAQYQSIEAKLKFALRTGGYENIVPVFQLALTLPLDNACCERGFSAMIDKCQIFRNMESQLSFAKK